MKLLKTQGHVENHNEADFTGLYGNTIKKYYMKC